MVEEEQWTSSDNLTPWQPGESGNPAGRPPNKASITYQIKKLLEAGEGIKARELAETAVNAAKAGSFPHFKEVIDRTDGKLGDVALLQDNRQFIMVTSEEAKQLLPGVKDRLLSTPESAQDEQGGEDAIE